MVPRTTYHPPPSGSYIIITIKDSFSADKKVYLSWKCLIKHINHDSVLSSKHNPSAHYILRSILGI